MKGCNNMQKYKFVLLIVFAFIFTATFMVACSADEKEDDYSSSQSTQFESSELEKPDVSSEPESNLTEQNENSTEELEEVLEEVIVSKNGNITGGSYSVSATVNLLSDNTLELHNFNYNGGAPDVYVAIGNIVDGGSFEKIKLVTDKLDGAYENQTISIKLEEGDAFNAVSVYCDAYSEDFGSTILIDVE